METTRAEERRQKIIDRLYRTRRETVANLAFDFGVCIRTIANDIDALSMSHPLETVRGRHGGGVRVLDGYYSDRRYLTDAEEATLESLRHVLEGTNLANVEAILEKFAKPKLNGRFYHDGEQRDGMGRRH